MNVQIDNIEYLKLIITTLMYIDVHYIYNSFSFFVIDIIIVNSMKKLQYHKISGIQNR